METLKNNKGFTLIELLAVIVVLAVVIAIGTTAVMPMVSNIKRGAFADEANIFMGTASNVLNFYDLGTISEPKEMDENYQKGTNKYCFSLKYLVEVGLIDKDADYFAGEDPEYAGKIIVNTNTDGTTGRYEYTITMHNKDYVINDVTGNVKVEAVKDYDKTGTFTCSPADIS